MAPPHIESTSVEPMTIAQVVAKYLAGQGVARLYGLVGGHIQPLWDAAARAGIEIVDVRHEGAAVQMAHAQSELTGDLGVALVTAGPGLTNAITAIANASVSRVPVLVICGRPPRPQAGLGAMQELPHADLVRPLARRVESLMSRVNVLGHLDAAISAAIGVASVPGPVLVDFPTDLLEETLRASEILPVYWNSRRVQHAVPESRSIEAARALIAKSRRPLIISGRTAHASADTIVRYLDLSGALYLDTGESRGAISYTHPSYVPAVRARAMSEADLVITLGRKLDYQLGYGSPAVFSDLVTFLRIGSSYEETGENRRGDVEIHSNVEPALAQLIDSAAFPDDLDRRWLEDIKEENRLRQRKLAETMAASSPDSTGRMHPYTLLDAINRRLDDSAIMVIDGGDILSFARAGLRAVRTLDCGSLGCLGVGVPFATAAALTCPNRSVFALIGDGALGFSVMELSTAARHRAKVLFVVANNAAWNIDRHDQLSRYGGHLVGVELPNHRYDLLAQSLGLHGQLVQRAEDVEAAIMIAMSNLPSLLNVEVSREPKSPDFKNGLAEVPSYQALRKWDELERLRYLP